MRFLVAILLCACGDGSGLRARTAEIAWSTPVTTAVDDLVVDNAGNFTAALHDVGCAQLVELSTDGDVRWMKMFEDQPPDPATFCPESFVQLAVDGRDDLIAVGTTRARLDAIDRGDILIRKLTTDGAIEWTRYHDGGMPGKDAVFGVAVDRDNNIVVGGVESRTAAQGIAFLGKYLPDGTPVWVQNTETVLGRWLHPHADASGAIIGLKTHDDDQGNIMNQALYKLFDDGGTMWERLTDAREFSLDDAGAAHITTATSDVVTDLVQIDPTGTARPLFRFPDAIESPDGKPVQIKWPPPRFLADGSLYFVTNTDQGLLFAHFTSAGEVVSLRMFQLNDPFTVAGIAIDARGQIAFGLMANGVSITAIKPD